MSFRLISITISPDLTLTSGREYIEVGQTRRKPDVCQKITKPTPVDRLKRDRVRSRSRHDGDPKRWWPAGVTLAVVAAAAAALPVALTPVTAATSASPATVMRELDALSGRRAELTAAIAKNHARADALAAAVRSDNLRARRDRADRRRSRGRLAALLVEQYKSSSSDSTAFLLAARSLSDLISRSETLDRLSADQAAVIATVAADEGKVRSGSCWRG